MGEKTTAKMDRSICLGRGFYSSWWRIVDVEMAMKYSASERESAFYPVPDFFACIVDNWRRRRACGLGGRLCSGTVRMASCKSSHAHRIQ